VQESASNRFKKRLRELRKARGWTQEKAAEKCGIGYKLYQLYELGVKRNPGLVNLEKIARGYGLDVSELLSPNFPKARIPATTRRKVKAKRGN
jgi:transcriptional regulator with XRE-family HTH domain